MGRKFLALIVGFITGVAVFFIVEMISTRYGSAPTQMEYMSRGELAAYWSSRPTELYVTELLGWLLACLTAGWIATKMTHQELRKSTLTIVVSVLLLVVGIVNMFVVAPGQPIWLIAVSLLATIPLGLLGYRIAL